MKPKYQALKETLIEQIRAGAFAEEFPIPSEAELSAKYSVSRNTVRQAMKELENEGYLYRARGKGTFIRNVSSLSSRKIALLLYDSRDLCHPVTMKMVSALSETLEQSGFLLDILASHRTFQEENLARLATNYAGFVLGTYRLDAMTVAELDKLAIPHLFVKSYLPGRDDPAVRIDFAKAGALAAQHLIECGCRTLGLVYPGRHIPIAAEFYDGICSASLENGVTLKREHVFETENYDGAKVEEAGLRIAELDSRPDGIIAASDDTAETLLEVFRRRGVRVPDDLMLTGCNDASELAKLTVPPLTTVHLPVQELGRRAGETITGMIRGTTFKTIMLEPELIIRQTTERHMK